MPSDNFNINNKNVIPSKYILVFDIQIKIALADRTSENYELEVEDLIGGDYYWSFFTGKIIRGEIGQLLWRLC